MGASLNKILYSKSNDPSLQLAWNCLQFGLLVFAVSPFLGAVTIILASLITWFKKYRVISCNYLHWGFALLSILLVISTAIAPNKPAAILGLFNLLPYFIVFTGLTALIQTPKQLRHIAGIIICGSLPIALIGWGQLFWGWNLQLQFLWIVLDWQVTAGGLPPGRISSIFMHANTLAAYLVTVVIFSLGLLLGGEAGNWKKKLFLVLAIVVNLVVLVLTNSRNGWAIAIIAGLAFAFYQGWRLIVGIVLSIASSMLLAAFAPTPIAQLFRRFVPYFIWARLNDDMYPDRPVNLMRKTQWQFAWSLGEQHPWAGWGLRSFTELYKQKTQINLGHPHNLFLMLFAETGFPCTLIFMGLLTGIFISASQTLLYSKSLTAADKIIFFSYLLAFIGWFLSNTVDVTIFDLRLCTLFWVFLASLCGVVYQNKNDSIAKIYVYNR